MPARRPARRLAITGLAALVGGLVLVSVPPPAGAEVTHQHGFRATVDGFTSWYGSYGMASLGTAWCIDHGSAAPDPAFRYVATALPGVPARTRVAMAWALGRHGTGTDPATHAALMLVLHDLMGATYPSGPLDVHRLGPSQLAGFRGQEGEVLRRARAIEEEAVARGVLEGPLRLELSLHPSPDGTVVAAVRLRDAGGRPVPGVDVELTGLAGAAGSGRTAADGTWRTRGRPAGATTVRAAATVPRLDLAAWAPTTRRAQRVARPGLQRLEAAAALAPPPTTTTTTTPPTTTTTTTTPPTTTTTTAPPTTTTAPPTTTTTTTAPPTTTTPAPPPSVPEERVPATVPPTVAGAAPRPPSLPRTGTDPLAWALLGAGLVLLGAAGVDAGRRAR